MLLAPDILEKIEAIKKIKGFSYLTIAIDVGVNPDTFNRWKSKWKAGQQASMTDNHGLALKRFIKEHGNG